jgi:hypothetical protein
VREREREREIKQEKKKEKRKEREREREEHNNNKKAAAATGHYYLPQVLISSSFIDFLLCYFFIFWTHFHSFTKPSKKLTHKAKCQILVSFDFSKRVILPLKLWWKLNSTFEALDYVMGLGFRVGGEGKGNGNPRDLKFPICGSTLRMPALLFR